MQNYFDDYVQYFSIFGKFESFSVNCRRLIKSDPGKVVATYYYYLCFSGNFPDQPNVFLSLKKEFETSLQLGAGSDGQVGGDGLPISIIEALDSEGLGDSFPFYLEKIEFTTIAPFFKTSQSSLLGEIVFADFKTNVIVEFNQQPSKTPYINFENRRIYMDFNSLGIALTYITVKERSLLSV